MAGRVPSVSLLRAFLRPSASICPITSISTSVAASAVRHGSSWTPRERFAQTKRIDKLHKKQKINNRIERQESEKRAHTIVPLAFAASSASSSSSVAAAAAASPASPSSETPSPSSSSTSTLPYFIQRTKSLNIPVYESTKAGGSKHITTLRKCAGDLEVLKTHILDALKLEPSFVDPRGQKKQNVVVNKLTNQLVIRGWRGAEVKEWCRLAGF